MPKYEVTLTETVRVVIEASNEEEAAFWSQTHSINDVQSLTAAYDMEFSEDVTETSSEEPAFSI